MQSDSHQHDTAFQEETYPHFSQSFDPDMGLESGAEAGNLRHSGSQPRTGVTSQQITGLSSYLSHTPPARLVSEAQETVPIFGLHNVWQLNDWDASHGNFVGTTSGRNLFDVPIVSNSAITRYNSIDNDLFQQFPNGYLSLPSPDVSYIQDPANFFNLPVPAPVNLAPYAPLPVAPSVAVPLGQTGTPNGTRFACNFCNNTYKRDKDRKRHEKEKHRANGPHFCQVHGCSNAIHGYARKDKLTEHLWKAHADLGFTKRV
ncbi:hypothetical protein B0J14DRAFT_649273 [Halenospora varia]|nr:hypothetical protein B0J14DRAFT_649273 [Halenospora varia]